MLTKRQSLILEKIIKDYIRLAQPISSQFLKKRHNLSISPATIRLEMQCLTEEGYLSQPHTSAGRIPTDKGYRFLVDKLLREKDGSNGPEQHLDMIEKTLEKERENIFRFAAHLTKVLSEASTTLSIVHFLGSDFFWKEGWEEVLREPEFEEKRRILKFAKFLGNFESNIDSFVVGPEIKVFIGRENPFPRAKDFSIISSRCHFPNEGDGVVALLGPKRMSYDKNINLLSGLV